MKPEIMTNYGYVLMVQTALMVFLVSPGFASTIWRTIEKRWATHKERKNLKRIRRAEERVRRYWEIDVKKLK